MIRNTFMITQKKYRCNNAVKRYLTLSCGLPILALSGRHHCYFLDNDELRRCLKHMPLHLKVLQGLW